MREEPSWRIILTRCASPPDRVPDGPVERQVAEPDLGERVEGLPQRGEQRRRPTARRARAVQPARSLICIAHASAMLIPLDLRGPGGLGQPGAVAVRADREGDGAVHEGADVRLHRVGVLRQDRPLQPDDQALVGLVDAADLHPHRLVVQEVVQLLLGELADRLVRVVEPRLAVQPVPPAAGGVAGDGERALVERLAVVVQLGQVDVGDRAPALAARAHAAGDGEAAFLLHGLARRARR